MLTWLTETTVGKIVATFFISMAPVVELRAGLPYGIALGLDYPVALAAAVLGNLRPGPFINVFNRRIIARLLDRRPGGRLPGAAAETGHSLHCAGRVHRRRHHDRRDLRPDPHLLKSCHPEERSEEGSRIQRLDLLFTGSFAMLRMTVFFNCNETGR